MTTHKIPFSDIDELDQVARKVRDFASLLEGIDSPGCELIGDISRALSHVTQRIMDARSDEEVSS